MPVNIFKSTLVPTIGDSRRRNVAPGVTDPLPDPQTGDLWIDMSGASPVLKVLDGSLSATIIGLLIGGSATQLQFNNSGNLGGVAGSSVSSGAITLAPTGATNTPLTITPQSNGQVGLIVGSRVLGTTDLVRFQNAAGTTIASINLDASGANNLGIITTVGTQISLFLQSTTNLPTADTLQIQDNNNRAVFRVSNQQSANGCLFVSPGGGPGVVISLPGASDPLACQISAGTTIFTVSGTGLIDLGGGATNPGMRVGSALGLASFMVVGNSRTLDIQTGTGPRTGLRITTANVFGTNDTLLTPLSDTTGWVILENFFGVTNQGVALSTSTTIPISFRPNRTEKFGISANGLHFSNRQDTTLANGANNNVAVTASFLKITGPSGAYSISGFTNGTDGARLTIYNGVSQTLTITNNGAGSSVGNKILTLTGADVVLRATAQSSATFIYDGNQSIWLLVATN